MPRKVFAALVTSIFLKEVESMAYYDPCYNPYACNCNCNCNCNCSQTSTTSSPAYICANGSMNDYARCALARYDQISYDLDTLPNLCGCSSCSCGCYPCCGQTCPQTCPPNCGNVQQQTCSGPSYLSAVNEAQQTVSSNNPILFATDRLASGNCIQHTAGTSTFTLNCPGVYLVDYNANVSVGSGSDVAVSMALLSGGAVVPGSESADTIASTSQNGSLSASTIITVPCGTTGNISLSNTSAGEVNVTNANIRIIRIL